MRVLITGASGLAGAHLVRACADAGDEVVGVSRSGVIPAWSGAGDTAHARATDLADAEAVRALLADTRPDVVYHLAALSSVGKSWENPAQTVEDNVAMSVNLLEALRHESPGSRVVWVSSCEVYGAADVLPIPEDAALRPANPYAVSKVTGDLLTSVYVDAFALNIVRARPFNHAAPGQRPIFLLSSLAQQGAQAKLAGAERIEIATGNPNTRRDFTDARDVARAYRLLAASPAVPAGSVFNVCSGISVSAAEQVALLAELIAPIAVEHVIDPARVRAHEVMDLRGSPALIREATGWEPQMTLRDTMSDTLAWWEHQLAGVTPG